MPSQFVQMPNLLVMQLHMKYFTPESLHKRLRFIFNIVLFMPRLLMTLVWNEQIATNWFSAKFTAPQISKIKEYIRHFELPRKKNRNLFDILQKRKPKFKLKPTNYLTIPEFPMFRDRKVHIRENFLSIVNDLFVQSLGMFEKHWWKVPINIPMYHHH